MSHRKNLAKAIRLNLRRGDTIDFSREDWQTIADILDEEQPLILKCDRYCISQEKLNEIRELMMKQKAEGVVVLPSGFNVANVDVSLLEEIKKGMMKVCQGDHCSCCPFDTGSDCGIELVINHHIGELKGENYGQEL